MYDQPRLTAALLRPQARGRWLEIFQYLCPGMFDEAIHKLGTHVTCPFHGGENDFRLIKRSTRKGCGNTAEDGVAMCTCGVYADGFAVLQRATGAPFIEVLKQLNEYLNGSRSASPRTTYTPVVATQKAPDNDVELLAKVNNLWANGKPLNIVETPYYVERGIDARVLADLRDVRTMASLGYFHKDGNELKKLGSFPAILALMRDPAGHPVSVHRTWLAKDRTEKAAVPSAKKLSASPGVRGAAIRLFEAKGDVLGICEGVETALAVRQLSQGRYWRGLGAIPVWACFAERNIRNFQIPQEQLELLTKIIVFADNDEHGTGMSAALEFQKRMTEEQPQLTVEIRMPEVVGWDWLDVLVNL